jgi:FkbM family methyltransferase
MPWREPWSSKVRRRLYGLVMKLFPPRTHFVTEYLGAAFLVRPGGVGTLELAAKIWERPELDHLMARCSELRPSHLIDVGANFGLYTCILLKQNVVARAIAFEPVRSNVIQLETNLLMNEVRDRVDIQAVALGSENARHAMLLSEAARPDFAGDSGFGTVIDGGTPPVGAIEIDVVKFDDRFDFQNSALVIKIDVENYECRVLAGMEQTLRRNRCLVQIETVALRDETLRIMNGFGYAMTRDFAPNLVFENRASMTG